MIREECVPSPNIGITPHAYTKKLRHPAAQSEADKFTDRLCAENLRLFDNVGCGENNMKIFKLMKSEVIHE